MNFSHFISSALCYNIKDKMQQQQQQQQPQKADMNHQSQIPQMLHLSKGQVLNNVHATEQLTKQLIYQMRELFLIKIGQHPRTQGSSVEDVVMHDEQFEKEFSAVWLKLKKLRQDLLNDFDFLQDSFLQVNLDNPDRFGQQLGFESVSSAAGSSAKVSSGGNESDEMIEDLQSIDDLL